MPALIDTHTHICDPVFDDDRTQVLDAAEAMGVGAVIAVGETLEDAEKNLTLSKSDPRIKPAAGLYPTILELDQCAKMETFICDHSSELIAIGEVGRDHWKVKEPEDLEVQKEIFSRMIRLSKETGLPLNIHSRSAGRHVIAQLLEEGAEKVHLHAFDGKYGTAIPAVEAGFFFSVPASIARSRQKQKLVKNLPLECLLVETDSPVLSPEPGERNEPKNCILAIEWISQLKKLSVDEVKSAIIANTGRLYPNM